MKKSIITVLSGVTLLSLAACGETTSDDGLSVEEIIDESMAAMDELDSYAMNMEMTQVMNLGDEGDMAFDSSGEASITMDPMTMEQTTRMDMGELGLGDEGDLEYLSYFSEEEGFFIEDPMMGDWIKLPENLMEDMLAMSEAQMSPQEQLEPFKEYLSDLSLETTDSSYIVTLEGEGLDMDTLIEQMSGLGIEGLDPMLGEMMGDIEFESLSYEITIDKDTFYQTESNIEMTLNMDVMGESLSTDQTIHMIFSEFNEIDPIEIPQDVLDNAEEMTEEEMTGGGF